MDPQLARQLGRLPLAAGGATVDLTATSNTCRFPVIIRLVIERLPQMKPHLIKAGENREPTPPIMKFTTTLSVTISTLLPFVGTRAQTPATRPNIVWILLEDWTTDLSCYGTKGISTPACDQLAEEGIRYTHAFCTAPVCSTSRSAMMTGFHQNFIGANQHRTADKRPLPEGIQPLPNLLQQAGYHTSLYLASKTDVNFETKLGFDSQKGWDDRKEGQPFFCQITLAGTHRPWKRDPENPIDPADVELPPYYADTAFVRRDWA
ncbi:MAG: N-sulfoglucosamine sulfohydrolase, family, partial [Planctomycetota bacterium]